MRILLCAAATMLCLASQALAQVRITEWMYNETPEFVEFTNFGPGPVNFTGWSFDDDSRLPGVFSLSGFGIVGVGESVVITEGNANDFRVDWGLVSSVKVLGGYTNNLGRNDEINLFDNNGDLVDRLSYGDQAGFFPGSIRTVDVSGNPLTDAALGANDVYQWVFSESGDRFGSYFSLGGQFGNPGFYPTIPEPSTLVLVALSGIGLWMRRR